MNEPLECAGGIGQPNGYDIEFKQTKFISKCRPMLVFRAYTYFMIPTLQVKAAKHTIPTQTV